MLDEIRAYNAVGERVVKRYISRAGHVDLEYAVREMELVAVITAESEGPGPPLKSIGERETSWVGEAF